MLQRTAAKSRLRVQKTACNAARTTEDAAKVGTALAVGAALVSCAPPVQVYILQLTTVFVMNKQVMSAELLLERLAVTAARTTEDAATVGRGACCGRSTRLIGTAT